MRTVKSVCFRAQDILEVSMLVLNKEITLDDAYEIVGNKTLIDLAIVFLKQIKETSRAAVIGYDYVACENKLIACCKSLALLERALDAVNKQLEGIGSKLYSFEEEMSKYDKIIEQLNNIDLSKLSNEDLISIMKFAKIYNDMIIKSRRLTELTNMTIKQKMSILEAEMRYEKSLEIAKTELIESAIQETRMKERLSSQYIYDILIESLQ